MSKNQERKCEKGIHDFIKTNFKEKNSLGFYQNKWTCKHCGTFIDNR